jgi:anthranilate phosphoribosyltransferase
MQQWIKEVARGKKGARHLSYDEAYQCAMDIVRGKATGIQVAALLIGLRTKGEAMEEFQGFVNAFRDSIPACPASTNALNCSGPYDGRHTFPITLMVSMILASTGFPQFLHGSESLPPKYGVAVKDVMNALGLTVCTTPQSLDQSLKLRFGFVWTDKMYPVLGSMRHAREQIGVRSMINTVEKLLNPVGAKQLLFGVNHRTAMEHLVNLAPLLGFETVYVVQGIEGSEDLPIYKRSAVRKINDGGDESFIIDPALFGFHGEELPKMNLVEQVQAFQAILRGEHSALLDCIRDHVVFNAGMRMYWFGKVSGYEEGFEHARSILESGELTNTVERWRSESHDKKTG